MWTWLNNNSGVLQFIAILVALFVLIYEWVISKRRRFTERRNLLEAVHQELIFNKKWIEDLIPQGEDAARYYDITRADFRLRDDAVNYAVTNGQSILLSDKRLLQHLIEVSHAVRFVNQQIEEQMLTRFSSPDFSSRITRVQIENSNTKFDWFNDRKSIPENFKDYMGELHLRHWAINNFGFWGQLKPSLEVAIPLVDDLIKEMDKKKKWWQFWKG